MHCFAGRGPCARIPRLGPGLGKGRRNEAGAEMSSRLRRRIIRIAREGNLMVIISQPDNCFRLHKAECLSWQIQSKNICDSTHERIAHVGKPEAKRRFGSYQFWNDLRGVLNSDVNGSCPLVPPSFFHMRLGLERPGLGH
jgi:hypothetical protein